MVKKTAQDILNKRKESKKTMYEFKPRWEIFWAAMVAAATFAVQVAATTDPSKVTDWRAWVIALAAGMARAAFAVVMNWRREQ